MQAIEKEAQGKIESAVDEGRKIAQHLQEEAQRHAKTTLERTSSDIQKEMAKARQELKDEVVEACHRHHGESDLEKTWMLMSRRN